MNAFISLSRSLAVEGKRESQLGGEAVGKRVFCFVWVAGV